MNATVVLGENGSVSVPNELCEILGLAQGGRVHLRVDGSSLVLQRPEDAVADLRGLASNVPRSRSLVDELLQDRRRGAAPAE